MRKPLFILFALWASTVFSQTYPAGYYDTAEGLKEDALKTALYNIIKGHTEFPYTSTATDVWDILKETDKDPNNAANVILLYTGWSVDAAQEYNGGAGWNREHVWAKSRGDFGEAPPAGTDCHHLRPADISVNSARNNRWFAECNEQYFDDGGTIPTDSWTSYTDWVWKPRDVVKGDVARMIFYMATRYEGFDGEPNLEVIDYLPADNSTADPIHALLSDLLLWHQQDPVDDFERNRNNVVYSYQNNRNPFIDHPELVDYIWGTSVGSIWSTSAITSSPSDGATAVAINTTITYTYSEAIRNIDNSEITNANVAALLILKKTNSGGSAVAFTATIDIDKKIITVTPTSNLANSQLYYSSVDAVEDGSDNAFAFTEIDFTTIAVDNTAPSLTTDPVENASSVAITTNITLTFNEAIRNLNDSEITDANEASLLTLKETNVSGSDVAFTATIDANKEIITINPDADLTNDQVYYVAIASVEDGIDNATSVESFTFTTAAAGSSGELFFSEYIEGSSYNKTVEIYNGTGSSVDLSDYSVELYSNGSAAPSSTATLSGTLIDGEVYVIYNSSADQAIKDEGDISSGVANFNGDDAIGLLKSGVLVDVIGEIGTDPGTSWPVAGTSGATLDNTLIRKIGRTSGNTDWASSAGTTTLNSEWIVLAVDVFSNLGAYPDITVWDGSVDTDWATAGNWSNGVPSSNYNASIPSGTVILGSAGSCYDLEIAAGAALTISGGNTLTASGDVVIQSDATTSGSLIISGILTSSPITYNGYMVADQWCMLGSPLSGQTINSTFLSNNSLSGMKDYIEGPTEAWNTDYISTAPDVAFSLGKGYATKRSASGVVSLTGTPNTVTQTFSLTRGGYGWNLLSNPFTSAITTRTGTANGDDNLLTENASVMDLSYTALYIWDAGSYKIINHASVNSVGSLAQDYLQVGQGFFVRAADGTADDFSITPAMQSHQTAVAFKSTEESFWTSITLTSESNSDKASTQIFYEENMSRGLDVGYDAGSFGSNSLYSRLIEDNGVNFAIQCLPTDYENQVVPIGLKAKDGDLVSFSAEAFNIPEEYAVVLEDRTLNTFTTLSEEGAKYTVKLTTDSDGIGRFFVHTVIQSALGLGDLETENIFQVYTRAANHQLVIRGETDKNAMARIYSITGKLLTTINLQQSTENTIQFNEDAGIYIVQIVNKNGIFTQKFTWLK